MAWDEVWEDVFSQQEWGKYPSEEVVRFVARNFYKVPDRKSVKILDLGCGPGAQLWYLAREGFSIYGIDGSKTAIEKARERLDQECPGWTGELKVGDITTLPFSDSFFDAVIDNEVIYANSLEDSRRIYTELARVCKVGGKLYSRTFATGCWGDQTGQKVGHNAYLVSEGPMFNKGLTRFTEYGEIHQLATGFQINEIDLLVRTVDSRQHEIKEWIILGEKV